MNLAFMKNWSVRFLPIPTLAAAAALLLSSEQRSVEVLDNTKSWVGVALFIIAIALFQKHAKVFQLSEYFSKLGSRSSIVVGWLLRTLAWIAILLALIISSVLLMSNGAERIAGLLGIILSVALFDFIHVRR